jgi:ribose/xylose/arabinose/galactoside ABC-type transport system permease subunit
MSAGAYKRIFKAKETGLLLVILLLGTLLSIFGGTITQKVRDPQSHKVVAQREINKFLQPANIDSVIKNASWTAVMAVGLTILIISGAIDLSIGAIYCLAAVAGALLMQWLGPSGAHSGTPTALVALAGIILTLAVGVLCGLANGGMVVLLRVHPFIVTLGTMSIFRGIAFVITQGQAVTNFPESFGTISRTTIHDFTLMPMIVLACVVLVGHVFLKHTVHGRGVYALGGNETACIFSGLNVGRIKLLVFTLAGLTGGIAAVITLGIFGSADSSTGRGYELDVIAAAVVGGASLTGGRGTALGALLGALVIQLIANGIVILEIDQNYTEIIKGAVIILAVVLDRLSARFNQ